MATKSSTKSTKTTKTSGKRASSRTAAKPAQKTARQCINEYEAVRFHVTIITVLSVGVCGLVAALLLSMAN